MFSTVVRLFLFMFFIIYSTGALAVLEKPKVAERADSKCDIK